MFNLLDSIVNGDRTYLLIAITSLVLGVVPFVYSIFLTIKYKKKEAKFKHFSMLYTSIMLALLGMGSLFAVISLFVALGVMDISSKFVAYIFTVFSIICSALAYISIFNFAHYFVFTADENGVEYFGENIKIDNINTILVDENQGFCYIVYFEGSRKVKKLKISKNLNKVIDNIDEIAKILKVKVKKTDVKEEYQKIYKERRSVDISSSSKNSNSKSTNSKNSVDLSEE